MTEDVGHVEWIQRQLTVSRRSRGFHLITSAVIDAIPELSGFSVGLLHIFIQHTSASLTINENADSDVRADMESALNRLVPDSSPFIHTIEGPDDMPAHVKSSLMGSSLTIPVQDGQLALGTWQGVYLCEHRNRGTPRTLILTLTGRLKRSGK